MENKKEDVSNAEKKKPWYKTGKFLGFILILISIIIGISSSNQNNQVKSEISTIPVSTYNSNNVQPLQPQNTINTVTANKTDNTTTNTLSNNNFYTNTAGNEVHSPAYSNSVPVGASAMCGDGTYSFSQNRRGTCSHHGGVSRWLN